MKFSLTTSLLIHLVFLTLLFSSFHFKKPLPIISKVSLVRAPSKNNLSKEAKKTASLNKKEALPLPKVETKPQPVTKPIEKPVEKPIEKKIVKETAKKTAVAPSPKASSISPKELTQKPSAIKEKIQKPKKKSDIENSLPEEPDFDEHIQKSSEETVKTDHENNSSTQTLAMENYKALLKSHIQKFWTIPENSFKNNRGKSSFKNKNFDENQTQAIVSFTILMNGMIQDISFVEGSEYDFFKNAIKRCLQLALPLPIPQQEMQIQINFSTLGMEK